MAVPKSQLIPTFRVGRDWPSRLKIFQCKFGKVEKNRGESGPTQLCPIFLTFPVFRPKNARKSWGKIPTCPNFLYWQSRSNEHPNPDYPNTSGLSSNPDLDFLLGSGWQSRFILHIVGVYHQYFRTQFLSIIFKVIPLHLFTIFEIRVWIAVHEIQEQALFPVGKKILAFYNKF